jgi:hypothetical protein
MEALLSAAKLPHAGSGLAVLVGFLDREKDRLWLFGTDHQVHVIL